MAKYTKQEFNEYRLERIAELETELEIWRNTKSKYTHLEAFEIVKTIQNNDFAKNLTTAKTPYALSPKQKLWLHILANREKPYTKPKDELKERRTKKKKKLEFKTKYGLETVEGCAAENGYYVRRIYSDDAKVYTYEVSNEPDFTEVVQLKTTKEVMQFVTGNNLEGGNYKYARKH